MRGTGPSTGVCSRPWYPPPLPHTHTQNTRPFHLLAHLSLDLKWEKSIGGVGCHPASHPPVETATESQAKKVLSSKDTQISLHSETCQGCASSGSCHRRLFSQRVCCKLAVGDPAVRRGGHRGLRDLQGAPAGGVRQPPAPDPHPGGRDALLLDSAVRLLPSGAGQDADAGGKLMRGVSPWPSNHNQM